MTSAEFTNAHPALAQFWHPVALSSDVGQGSPVAEPPRRSGPGHWPPLRRRPVVGVRRPRAPHRRARLVRPARSPTADTAVPVPRLGDSPPMAGAWVFRRSRTARPSRGGPRCAARPRSPSGTAWLWLAPEPPRRPHPGPASGCATRRGTASRRVILPGAAGRGQRGDSSSTTSSDEAHLPFVHAATIGGAGPEPIPRADRRRPRPVVHGRPRAHVHQTSPTPRCVMAPGRRCSAAG